MLERLATSVLAVLNCRDQNQTRRTDIQKLPRNLRFFTHSLKYLKNSGKTPLTTYSIPSYSISD